MQLTSRTVEIVSIVMTPQERAKYDRWGGNWELLGSWDTQRGSVASYSCRVLETYSSVCPLCWTWDIQRSGNKREVAGRNRRGADQDKE